VVFSKVLWAFGKRVSAKGWDDVIQLEMTSYGSGLNYVVLRIAHDGWEANCELDERQKLVTISTTKLCPWQQLFLNNYNIIVKGFSRLNSILYI